MSEGDWLKQEENLRIQRIAPRGRSVVCGVGFYYFGRDYCDITFFRYDPAFSRGQISRAYQFTGASARRVQRLIHDGKAESYLNGNGNLYKQFREWPKPDAAEGWNEMSRFKALFAKYDETGDDAELMRFMESVFARLDSLYRQYIYWQERTVKAEGDTAYLRGLLQIGVEGIKAFQFSEANRE